MHMRAEGGGLGPVIHAGVRAAFLLSLLIVVAASATPVRAQEPEGEDPEGEELTEEEKQEDAEFDEFLDALTAREAAEMTPAEVAEKGTIPGMQDGGADINVVAPGNPPTIARGDTLPRPDDPRDTPQPDDPRDAPPPTIYGEEICPSGNVRGQFEPVQGVWQDDPTFPDKPGKRIIRLSPVSWRAELPMVTGRKSLNFGVERASEERRRNEIFVKGEATGTERIPVKFRFTLKQSGGQKVVYESEVLGEIPVGGPCRPDAVLPFEVSIDATDGLPPEFDRKYPEFTFDDGEYILEAELVTPDGRATGIKVTVMGRSVTTTAPKIAFRVVNILSAGRDPATRESLQDKAITLSAQSGSRIPDWFPIRHDRLKTRVFPPQDRGDLLAVLARQPKFTELRSGDAGGAYFAEGIREELLRQMQVGGLMSGFDRVVVLVGAGDFRIIWHGSFDVDATQSAAAFAASQKVVLVNFDYGTPEVVAHEIIHTLPYIFSGDQMLAECDIDYHNVGSYRVGHGHRITFGLKPFRERTDNSTAIMGPVAGGGRIWITQCSYRHLLQVLSAGVPDPRVLLVQGFVSRSAAGTAGFFQPFYDLDGVEDLAAGGEGSWAIVLKDAPGNVLARYAWEPQWKVPDMEPERTLVAFASRLLRPEGLASVELQGPDGLLDTRVLSMSAPAVTILAPAENDPITLVDGEVVVEWAVSDADGDPVVSTVLYSPDGGEMWMDVVVETAETSVRVPLDPEAPREAHRVLVRATDGGRSSDAVRTLQPAPEGE
jgi:hypothetical protein